MAVPLFYNRQIKRATLPNLNGAWRGHLWLEAQFHFTSVSNVAKVSISTSLGTGHRSLGGVGVWVFSGECAPLHGSKHTIALGWKSLAKGSETGLACPMQMSAKLNN